MNNKNLNSIIHTMGALQCCNVKPQKTDNPSNFQQPIKHLHLEPDKMAANIVNSEIIDFDKINPFEIFNKKSRTESLDNCTKFQNQEEPKVEEPQLIKDQDRKLFKKIIENSKVEELLSELETELTN